MSNAGGGAEAHARFKQYDYKANSSLVLNVDQRPRDSHEPTGEPESLWGKINPRKFGDRVAQGRPQEGDEAVVAAKKRKEKREKERTSARGGVIEGGAAGDLLGGRAGKKQKKKGASGGPAVLGRFGEESVLSLADDGMYRPRTKETRAAYEVLLNAIQQQFGDQPQDVLRGAADEVLAVLKDDHLTDPERKVEVEKLLNPMAPERFAEFVAIGKRVTDYQVGGGGGGDGGEGAGEGLDDDIGVAVEFEEEEEEEDEDLDEVQDSDGEEEEEEEDGRREDAGMQLAGGLDDDLEEDDERDLVSVQDIDAYWLQRKIATAYGGAIDPQHSQKLAGEVLTILEDSMAGGNTSGRSSELGGDEGHREAENKLVRLLDYDKFELIKVLLRNRARVVWCTRLARAPDEASRAALEEQMAAADDPVLRGVLEQLHATRATAKERQKILERSIREEARRLKEGGGGGEAEPMDADVDVDVDNAVRKRREEAAGEGRGKGSESGGGGGGGWLKGQRQVLDLEALAFPQGGLLMANKRCELPEGSYRAPKKGYEEVHVPALKPRPLEKGEELVKISDLPEWAQPAFGETKSLNRVQSKVYETALFTPENMLLCAPTGAGKTNVAMLTILHELGLHRREEDGSLDLSAFKIVYVAPMKALVAEVVGNLGTRLKSYGVTVRELTGDANLSKQQIEETQVREGGREGGVDSLLGREVEMVGGSR